jgi:hypothetical protein
LGFGFGLLDGEEKGGEKGGDVSVGGARRGDWRGESE